jgi:two-component system, NarL family, invasion response regulator UvrY
MKHNPYILVVEDHDIVASALELLITDHFHSATVRKVNAFPKALRLLESGQMADLIILDVDIPGGESYGMVASLRDKQPNVRILIFTGQDEKKHALKFLGVGANGFVPKNSDKSEVGLAIRTVMNDQKFVTAAAQQLITHNFFEKLNPAKSTSETPLSPREKEVLELLLQGKWTKEIASELKLKLTTVSTHKSRIFEKMEVTNVIELFKKLDRQ